VGKFSFLGVVLTFTSFYCVTFEAWGENDIDPILMIMKGKRRRKFTSDDLQMTNPFHQKSLLQIPLISSSLIQIPLLRTMLEAS
jgi:hypothetical protein